MDSRVIAEMMVEGIDRRQFQRADDLAFREGETHGGGRAWLQLYVLAVQPLKQGLPIFGTID